MEWVLWIVVAIMLALLCYTVLWTSIALNKKGQPVVDSFFDALHAILRRDTNPHIAKDRHPGKSKLS
jgi:hypothetical protein